MPRALCLWPTILVSVLLSCHNTCLVQAASSQRLAEMSGSAMSEKAGKPERADKEGRISLHSPSKHAFLDLRRQSKLRLHSALHKRQLFHSAEDSGARRLEAADGRPARTKYEASAHGHRFEYEFAGKDVDAELLHLDAHPSLHAYSCSPLKPQEVGHKFASEARASLRRLIGNTSSPGKVARSDDLIHLKLQWLDREPRNVSIKIGTLLALKPQLDCMPQSGGSLLFRVAGKLPETQKDTTALAVHMVTPFEVVHDVFLNFRWQPEGPPSRRRLGRRLENPTYDLQTALPSLGFNFENGSILQEQFILGPLLCEDCFASFQRAFEFELRTTGVLPQLIRLRLSGGFNLSMNLGINPALVEELIEGWQVLLRQEGPELIQQALAAATAAAAGAATGGAGSSFFPVLLPLFSQLTDALDVALVPALELQSILETLLTIIMDGRISLNIQTNPDDTFVELLWDVNNGLSANASLDRTVDVGFTGTSISDNITAGLRACVGLELMILNSEDPFADMKVCPEAKSYLEFSSFLREVAFPEELAPSSLTPDLEVCFTFVHFETDGDLDVINKDEPYGKACLVGQCVQTTSDKNFVGERVTWDQTRCISSTRAAVEEGNVYIEFHEEDILYDDIYTEPHALRLTPETCPGLESGGCVLDLTLKPKPSAGSFARARMQISAAEISTRRLDEQVLTQQCQGLSAGVSLGVSGTFGGFHYPVFFTRGKDDVVSPAGQAPAYRPDAPFLTCEAVRRDGGALSAAFYSSGNHWPNALLVAVVLLSTSLQYRA